MRKSWRSPSWAPLIYTIRLPGSRCHEERWPASGVKVSAPKEGKSWGVSRNKPVPGLLTAGQSDRAALIRAVLSPGEGKLLREPSDPFQMAHSPPLFTYSLSLRAIRTCAIKATRRYCALLAPSLFLSRRLSLTACIINECRRASEATAEYLSEISARIARLGALTIHFDTRLTNDANSLANQRMKLALFERPFLDHRSLLGREKSSFVSLSRLDSELLNRGAER